MYLRQLDNFMYHLIIIIYLGVTFILLLVFKNRSKKIFIFSFLFLCLLLIITKDPGDTSGLDKFLLFFCIGINNKYIKLNKTLCFILPIVLIICININGIINDGTISTITNSIIMLCVNSYIYLNEFGILQTDKIDWSFLTENEKQYVMLLHQELTIKEKAYELKVSESYIKQLSADLRKKVGVKTDVGLMMWACDNYFMRSRHV